MMLSTYSQPWMNIHKTVRSTQSKKKYYYKLMNSTNVLTVRTLSSEQLMRVYKAVTKPEPVLIPKPIRKHYNVHSFG